MITLPCGSVYFGDFHGQWNEDYTNPALKVAALSSYGYDFSVFQGFGPNTYVQGLCDDLRLPLTFFPGRECMFDWAHITTWDLAGEPPPLDSTDFRAVLADMRPRCRMMIVAHPFEPFIPQLEGLLEEGLIDAVEVVNGESRRTDEQQPILRWLRDMQAKGKRPPVVGGMDIHTTDGFQRPDVVYGRDFDARADFPAVDRNRTAVLVEEFTPEAILRAVRAGRSAVEAGGVLLGDPEFVAELERAGYWQARREAQARLDAITLTAQGEFIAGQPGALTPRDGSAGNVVLRVIGRASRGVAQTDGPSGGDVKASIGDLHDRAISDKSCKAEVDVALIDKKAAGLIRQEAGFDLTGGKWVLDADHIRHILKQHASDSLPIGRQDILCLPEIINAFDSVQRGNTTGWPRLPGLLITKRINGMLYVVGAVAEGKREIRIKTMYKKAAADIDRPGVQHTSETFPPESGMLGATGRPASPATNIIGAQGPEVKSIGTSADLFGLEIVKSIRSKTKSPCLETNGIEQACSDGQGVTVTVPQAFDRNLFYLGASVQAADGLCKAFALKVRSPIEIQLVSEPAQTGRARAVLHATNRSGGPLEGRVTLQAPPAPACELDTGTIAPQHQVTLPLDLPAVADPSAPVEVTARVELPGLVRTTRRKLVFVGVPRLVRDEEAFWRAVPEIFIGRQEHVDVFWTHDWRGPDDCSARVQWAWDEHALHMRAVVTDDVLTPFRRAPKQPMFGDSLQIAINPIDREDLPPFGIYDMFITRHLQGDYLLLDRNPRIACESIHRPWEMTMLPASMFRTRALEPLKITRTGATGNSKNTAEGGCATTSTRTELRLSLPWHVLVPMQPLAGYRFGMFLILWDNDGDGCKASLQWPRYTEADTQTVWYAVNNNCWAQMTLTS